MQPKTTQDWIDVAIARGADADALGKERPASIAAVYMVGYAVECSLKAYLRSQGKPFPERGSAGHNLRALWKQSGFQLRDLADENGTRTYFVEGWTTSLRYSAGLPALPSDQAELLNGAKNLVKFLRGQMKRNHRGSASKR